MTAFAPRSSLFPPPLPAHPTTPSASAVAQLPHTAKPAIPGYPEGFTPDGALGRLVRSPSVARRRSIRQHPPLDASVRDTIDTHLVDRGDKGTVRAAKTTNGPRVLPPHQSGSRRQHTTHAGWERTGRTPSPTQAQAIDGQTTGDGGPAPGRTCVGTSSQCHDFGHPLHASPPGGEDWACCRSMAPGQGHLPGCRTPKPG